MSKKILWTLGGAVVALAVAGGISFTKVSQFQAMGAAYAQMSVPPTVVNAIAVQEQTLQEKLSVPATISAIMGTEVSAEADGIVRSIAFTAGEHVQQGATLLQLDIELEQAQLRSAEAAAQSARLTLERARALRKSNSTSQADLDIATSNADQARAQVDYYRTLIDKKTIRAPFAGKLGLRQVSEGQFLMKGSSVVTLQALDEVYVDFAIPQNRLGQIASGQQVQARVDAWPGQTFTGTVLAVNPVIDPVTRSVRIQARLANPESRLLPGMYVALETAAGPAREALLVPETAILRSASGNSVFVLEKPEKDTGDARYVLRQTNVRTGAQHGDFIEIAEGLRAGEQVVSTAVFKLQNGSAVVIDERLAPKFSLTPHPDNT